MTTILNLGPETRVNTTTYGTQGMQSIAHLDDGGYAIVWESQGSGSSTWDIYLQRFDADGQRIGGETLVNTTTAGVQQMPHVVSVGGGYVVTWESDNDGDGYGIFAQMYDASGARMGGEFRVNTQTVGTQYGNQVISLAGGGFVVSWQTWTGGADGYQIHTQRFTGGGVPDGSETTVSTNATSSNFASSGVALSDGSYVIAWHGYNGQENGIWAQAYTQWGQLSGTAFRIDPAGGHISYELSMTATSDGGFVAVWSDQDKPTDDWDYDCDIFAQRFDAHGNKIGDAFQVNTLTTGNEGAPNVATLSDGGFVIAWNVTADAFTDHSIDGVYVQRYDADGHPVGPETRITHLYTGTDTMPQISPLSDGGFVVSYTTFQDGSGPSVNKVVFGPATSTVGAQYLYGTGDADDLDGGSGNDHMYGGNGDDVYHVNGAGDEVYELADQGNDTVVSAVSYVLGEAVENLTLTGAGNLNGTGNALDNVITGNAGRNMLTGGDGDDTIDGGRGNDVLDGGTGDDWLNGGDGNDVIHASTGSDWISGDAGIDTYDASALLVGEGINLATGKVVINGVLSHISGIENVIGSAYSDTITGDASDNVIDGGAGADTMSGGLGDDIYYVDNAGDVVNEVGSDAGGNDSVFASVSFSLAGQFIETLTLTGTSDINATGNSLVNTLVGNSGNNTLDGGYGADTMAGGLGNDIYIVDNSGDTVTEITGQGTDTVRSSISYTLGDALENLTLTGGGNINGTGNSLNNALTGNSGNNTLDGGYGADTMAGGTGNDTYYVDNASDVVTELSNQGTDTVISSVSFSLAGQHIENLTLTGGSAVNGTGNGLANTLTGNSGNNVLDGGYGNDVLWGLDGADTFLFGAANGQDTIKDFSAAQGDSINVHAVSHGTAHAGWITQVGADVHIDLGGGNIVTVVSASVTDVSAHMVW